MSRAAVLLAAVVLVATACGSPQPPPATPPTSSAPAGPSLSALEGWQQIELSLDNPQVRLTTLVAAGAGFVAAGGSPQGALAWSSADGEAWVQETVPGGMRFPTEAVSWGDRVLLVGGAEEARCAHPAAIDTWVRDAAGQWSHAPFQEIFCAGGSAEVAVAGGLAVIVGAGAGDQAYTWSSGDGLHWVDHPGVFDGIGLPSGVLATAAGFVALGWSEQGPWFERTVDGGTWRDHAKLPGPTQGRPLGAAVIGTRLVVFLGDPAGPVRRLSSEEPSTWTVDRAEGLVSSSLIRIEAIPGGLVAIGGEEQGPALWVSGDGVAWRRVTLPQGAVGGYIAGVAVGQGRAVILGGVSTPAGDIVPAGWVGPASLLAS
ncbi:MAG: hypothetical protein M3R57_09135 [Chloroflexota bacterium]|nr:hypothetical protein [Chloroflexota bacterium]